MNPDFFGRIISFCETYVWPNPSNIWWEGLYLYFVGYHTLNWPELNIFGLDLYNLYIYKVVNSACLFVCIIITCKHLERFAWNFYWKNRYNPAELLSHACMLSPLAPDPIKGQSCDCCLFWINRNSMVVTSIFLSIIQSELWILLSALSLNGNGILDKSLNISVNSQGTKTKEYILEIPKEAFHFLYSKALFI